MKIPVFKRPGRMKSLADKYCSLIITALVFFANTANAQLDTTSRRQLINGNGFKWPFVEGSSGLIPPRDTFRLSVRDTGAIAWKNGAFYQWSRRSGALRWDSLQGKGGSGGSGTDSASNANFGLIKSTAGTIRNFKLDTAAITTSYLPNHPGRIQVDTSNYLRVGGIFGDSLWMTAVPSGGGGSGYNNFINADSVGMSTSNSAGANATAFASAIAAAKAAGKDLFLPKIYTINPVTISQNTVRVFGLGPLTSGLKLPSGVSADTRLLTISGDSVTISDLMLDGNHSNYTATTDTKGIYLSANYLTLDGVSFKNEAYGLRAIGSGSSHGIKMNLISTDSIGVTGLNITDYGDIIFNNSNVTGWGGNDHSGKGVAYATTAAGRSYNISHNNNQYYNTLGSTNFGVETAGALFNINGFTSTNEYIDGKSYQCGGWSMGFDNVVFNNPTFKSTFQTAYAMEISGTGIQVNAGTLQGLLRYGPYNEDTCGNFTMTGTVFNLVKGGSNYDHVLGFGSHRGARQTTHTSIDGVTLTDVTINGVGAKPLAIAVLGYYGGLRSYINNFKFNNLVSNGDTILHPVLFEFAGYGGKYLSLDRSTVFGGGKYFQIDTGVSRGVSFTNNIHPTGVSILDGTVTSSSSPNLRSVNNLDTAATAKLVINTASVSNGSGSPEGVRTENIGSIYTDISTGSIYTKTTGTGNTGWSAVSGGGGSAPVLPQLTYPGVSKGTSGSAVDTFYYNVFNVRDRIEGAIGAIPDSSTDAAPAIQAHIDYINAHGKKGSIYLPGIYKINSPLHIPPGCKITMYGDGGGGEVYVWARSKLVVNSATMVAILDSSDNFQIHDIEFQNVSGSTPTAGAAIRTSGNYGHIYNCSFGNFYKGIDFTNAIYPKVTNCAFSDNVFAHISTINNVNPDGGDLLVEGCNFATTSINGRSTQYAIYQTNSGGTKIIGCKMNAASPWNGTFYKGDFDGSVNSTSDLSIQGCSIENFTGYAADISCKNNADFSNISIIGGNISSYRNGSGVRLLESSGGIIRRVQISTTFTNMDTAIIADGVDQLVISGNVIDASTVTTSMNLANTNYFYDRDIATAVKDGLMSAANSTYLDTLRSGIGVTSFITPISGTSFTTKVQDDFNRTNTTNIAGSTPSPTSLGAWASAYGGGGVTLGISSNQLYCPTSGAVLDYVPGYAGDQNNRVVITNASTTSGGASCLLGRYTDDLNYIQMTLTANSAAGYAPGNIYTLVGGVATLISSASTTVSNGDTMTLRIVGNVASAYKGQTLIGSGNFSPAALPNYNVGLLFINNTATTLDHFIQTDQPIAAYKWGVKHDGTLTGNGTDTLLSVIGSGGFVNPMTTTHDLIEGGAAGTPTRLATGGAGQTLHGGNVWKDTIPSSFYTWDAVMANGAVTSRSPAVTNNTNGALGIDVTNNNAGASVESYHALRTSSGYAAFELFGPGSAVPDKATFTASSGITGGLRMQVAANAPFEIATNGTSTNTRMVISGTGAVKFNNYGAGTNTGTAAYGLSVDASGNVIETTAGGGSATWGSIGGTLSSQSDLNTALGLKAPSANPTFSTAITTPKIISSGSAPTIAASTAAGTGPTISISGNDLVGTITLVCGTSPASTATMATVTFNVPYAVKPHVFFTPANLFSLNANNTPYIDDASSSTTQFVIKVGGSTLTSGLTYIWYYQVIQ
jgi:hypothetical protein